MTIQQITITTSPADEGYVYRPGDDLGILEVQIGRLIAYVTLERAKETIAQTTPKP